MPCICPASLCTSQNARPEKGLPKPWGGNFGSLLRSPGMHHSVSLHYRVLQKHLPDLPDAWMLMNILSFTSSCKFNKQSALARAQNPSMAVVSVGTAGQNIRVVIVFNVKRASLPALEQRVLSLLRLLRDK